MLQHTYTLNTTHTHSQQVKKKQMGKTIAIQRRNENRESIEVKTIVFFLYFLLKDFKRGPFDSSTSVA